MGSALLARGLMGAQRSLELPLIRRRGYGVFLCLGEIEARLPATTELQIDLRQELTVEQGAVYGAGGVIDPKAAA